MGRFTPGYWPWFDLARPSLSYAYTIPPSPGSLPLLSKRECGLVVLPLISDFLLVCNSKSFTGFVRMLLE